jgi:hypothetical protein
MNGRRSLNELTLHARLFSDQHLPLAPQFGLRALLWVTFDVKSFLSGTAVQHETAGVQSSES